MKFDREKFINEGKIDPYKRVQTRFLLIDLCPTPPDGTCACGCGVVLTGRRRRWANEKCPRTRLGEFRVIKGDSTVIRMVLWEKDQGHCRECGAYDEKWQADHIIPVNEGGGGTTIDNFQTLCLDCHKEKSGKYLTELATKRAELNSEEHV